MPELRIRCFGNLRIEVDGQPINHFDTDKTRALLVYLAIENQHPHPRSHLAGMLWSDQPEEQALHSLRQTLSSLRRTIGDHTAASPHLLIERESVGLNPGNPAWIDTHVFQAGLDAAYRHYQRRDHGGWLNARRLAAALALRQGAFLAHLHVKGAPLFDEWQTITCEDLDQRALQGLALLAEIYERRGEYALARQTAQRMIDIAPWDEQAHVQLMRLFALDGQRSAAQGQYRTLRRFLHEQLGVEPASETTALFEQIRSTGDEACPCAPQFPPNHSNVPVFSTPFIGRVQELDEITDLLVDPACRLLTLFGPGGIGKTRLALEAARQQIGLLSDGVFFVPLSTVSTGEQVSAAIADALGLVLTDQSDPHARLLDYLHEKRMLLVLDTFEHLLDEMKNTRPIIDILEQAAGVTLLVTSRERLMLQEEWVYPLAGLRYPLSRQPADMHAVPEWAEQYDALRLFYQRARQVQFGFSLDAASLPYAIRICQMLEGLPLGVELAAAALWNQPCSAIADKIAQRLDSLSAPAVNISPRHRSLWAAFEVSWQLLSPEEKALFRRLGVFQGGFTPVAAQRVAGATPDLLGALANQSLLRLDPEGRYSMHEAVRQFANEKLAETGNADQTRAAHARYFCAFLTRKQPLLHGLEQKQALSAIHAEIGNAEIAWQWITGKQDIAANLSCVDALYRYFNIRSRFLEGIALFQPAARALEEACATGRNPAAPKPEAEAALGVVLCRIGSLAHYARQNGLALEALERAAEIFSRLDSPAELAFCRTSLGGVYLRAKDFARAQACAEQNLEYYRQAGDPQGKNRALYLLGLIHNRLGKLQESKHYFMAAVEVGRQGEEPRRLMAPLNMLGDIACTEGNYSEAESLFEQSLAIARALQDLYYQAIVLNNLANVYHYNHQFAMARKMYEESLSICKEIGDRDGEAMALNNLGELSLAEGDYARAITFSEQALVMARQIGEEWTITACLNNLGEASNASGRPEQAMRYLAEAIRLAWDIEAIDSVARFAVNAGRSFQLQERRAAAEIYRAALAHSATEHDAREKAAAWLKEMGLDPHAEQDDGILEETVSRLILRKELGNATQP
jgi:predicted ATPase/DNA-binding SARP family transcriptional activator